ncbi:MAG: VWA domain-containing protein [Deltaproteobacteria bacterium]|nr:VWA domain-containing protein [Deltaproteobacteria bacterium]
MTRLVDYLSPIMERLGPDAVDDILRPVAAIALHDRRTAFAVLERYPEVIEKLLPRKEQTILAVLGLANECLPYGTGLTIHFLETAPQVLEASDIDTLIQTTALACSISQVNQRTAEALMIISPAVLERLGFEGLRAVALLASVCARFSWHDSIRIMEQSPGQIDRLAAAGADRSCILAVYGLSTRTAQTDWNIALALVEKSAVIVDQLITLGGRDLVSRLYRRAESTVPFHARVVDAFLDAAPVLIERLGLTGSEPLWQCAFTAAADKPEDAVSVLKKSLEITENLLFRFDPVEIGAIYDLGRQFCRFGSSLALKFIFASPELTKKLNDEDMVKLTAIAEDLATTSLTAAEAFLDTAPVLIDRMGITELKNIAALSTKIAETSWETAARILVKSPELIDRVGIGGLKMIGDFIIPLARQSTSEAIRLLDKCPLIIDDLLKIGDIQLIENVCRLGSGIFSDNARLAASLLAQSPEIMKLTGLEGLQKIKTLVHELGNESWTTAASLLETAPCILEQVGVEGLEEIAGLARQLAKENSYNAVSLIEKSPDLIRRLQAFGDEILIRRIYELARTAASSHCKLAAAFLEHTPALLSKIGYTGTEKLMDMITAPPAIDGIVSARLLETAAAVWDQMDFKGMETLTSLASMIAATDQTGAVSLLEKSPILIEKLHHLVGDPLIAPAVYERILKLSHISPPIAMRLFEKSFDLIGGFGMEGFYRITDIIESQAKTDEQKALASLAADSTILADFMENIPKGLELKAIRPILSTYLRALLGRRVEIAEADHADTDGRKIYLPGRVRDFQDPEDNFILYKVEATHQEAHFEYGSFDFDMDRIPDLTDRIVFRYGLIADEDESQMERFIHHFPEPDLARDLFHVLEDRRIEGILKKEYPILGEHILNMNRHRVSKMRSVRKIANPKQRVVEMIGQALKTDRTFDQEDEETMSVLQKAFTAAGDLSRTDADVHLTAEWAAKLYFLIDAAFEEPYHPLKSISRHLDQERVSRNIGSFSRTARHIQERLSGQPSAQDTRPQTAIEAPGGSSGETTPTNTLPDQESTQRRHPAGSQQTSFQGPTQGGKPESGESDTEARQAGAIGGPMKYDSPERIERLLRAVYREKGLTPREVQERFDLLRPSETHYFLSSLDASLERKTELLPERGTALYAEWGEDIGAFRNNWSRVREQTHAGVSLTFYRETLEKHGGLLKKIRREFQMLKPEGLIRLKRQYDGDDIDLDAVVEYILDRKVGLSPPEKNYRLTRKNKREIACAFLIDMSRSTRGTTIRQEKEALIIIAEALNEVGDTFAVFGFSGDNRDNVDFYRIKDFDVPYDKKVKQRISAIEDHFENRDGTAIRHATQKLKKRAERTKILIILSDGKPVDKEYSGVYAIEDTRMALKEARHDGVKTFCITVDQNAAEYLPRMYSHSSWTVIDNVVKLPEKITRIYRMLTT